MSAARSSSFLRLVLLADAAVSGASGLLMTFLAAPLASLLQVPQSLLFWAGVILLPYAAWVAWLSRKEMLPRWAVLAVIACNALWAADCLILMLSGRLAPSALGYAFILIQALVVAAFAEMQYIGLRRLGPAPAQPSRT